ncbi:MAG: class I SAM-dependent methyltransferase [Gammaproteobacteria bacterium]
MKKNIKLALGGKKSRRNGHAHMDLDAVRNAYRRYAGFYDVYFGPVMQKGRHTAIRKMSCNPGDRILEVGVGTGLTLDLYPSDVEITGIDVSSEMLERARARKERLRLDHVVALSVMDAERTHFSDHSFDKVAAIYVASVVPHPERLVNEMRRVCKPGGELFFLNHFKSRNRVLGGIERFLAPLSRLLGFRTDLSLDTFIQETNLDVIDKSRANVFGYWVLIRARNNSKTLYLRALDRESVSVHTSDFIAKEPGSRFEYVPCSSQPRSQSPP